MDAALVKLLDLQGKVAIVTGGAQGIGRGIAEVLSAAGARVVIADRNRDEADALATSLRQQGRSASAVSESRGRDGRHHSLECGCTHRLIMSLICGDARR